MYQYGLLVPPLHWYDPPLSDDPLGKEEDSFVKEEMSKKEGEFYRITHPGDGPREPWVYEGDTVLPPPNYHPYSSASSSPLMSTRSDTKVLPSFLFFYRL